jgi:RNA polymerase sigma factor (sigma-70 family)
METRTQSKPTSAFRASPTRSSLIGRLADWSDNKSWQEFFELYWELIYALAVQSGLNEHEAEEAVQMTMVTISQSIREFKYDPKIGKFRGWVATIAMSRIRDLQRKRMREQRHLQRPGKKAPDEDSRTATIERIEDERDFASSLAEREWDAAVEEVALSRVRRQVNPKHFQIFDLHVIKCRPIGEVAELLQVSRAQVYLIKSRISRLLKQHAKTVAAELDRVPPPPKTNNPTCKQNHT